MAPENTDQEIVKVLHSTKIIAIVGASANPDRDSFEVMKFLQSKNYRCIPVNPGLAGQTILGELAFPDLLAIPFSIDMVDIFRRPEFVEPVVDQAIAIGAKFVWMQLGVVHHAAASRAENAGLTVIMDRCPKIEFRRLAHMLEK